MDREPMLKVTFDKLTEELNQLKSVERSKVEREIDEARALGDLKENAEYHSAKDRQGLIEARIVELSDILSRALVLNPADLPHKTVSFGSTVVLFDHSKQEEIEYTIVGTQETNPSKGLISIKSPLAKALLGKEEGDEVEMKLPSGNKSFDIEEVKYKEIKLD